MPIPSLSSREVEQDRLRQASELAADSGERWADAYRPGSPGCHELLDRASLLSEYAGTAPSESSGLCGEPRVVFPGRAGSGSTARVVPAGRGAAPNYRHARGKVIVGVPCFGGP